MFTTSGDEKLMNFLKVTGTKSMVFSVPQDLLYVNFCKDVENMVQITHTTIKK